MNIIDSFVSVTWIRQSIRERMPTEVRSAILCERKAWRQWQRLPTKANKKAYNVTSRTCSRALYQY